MKSTRARGIGLAFVTAVISGVAVFVNSTGVAAYGSATAYTTAKNAAAAMIIALVFVAARAVTGAEAGRAQQGASGTDTASGERSASGARPRGTASGRRSVSVTRPTRGRQWWGLAFVAVLGGAVPFVLFFEGLARTASTQAAFIHKTLVVWVAVLAIIVLKEKLTVWHGVAIGLLVVAQFGLAGDVAIAADAGTAMIAGATLMWAVEVVVVKRLLKDLSPWTISLTRMVGGAVVLLAWSGMTGGIGAVLPRTGEQWMWVAITGVLLAGYVLSWHQALLRAQAVDVTAVLVLAAIITAVLAGTFRGAPLVAQAPWLAMIAAGGLMVWLAPRRRIVAPA